MKNNKNLFRIWSESNVSSGCIVRITNKCNLECKHCCFRSGPEYKEQMSEEICEQINQWVPTSILINIMGGEFTVLKNYQKLLLNLSTRRPDARIVTNGIFLNNHHKTIYFIKTIKKIIETCPKLNVYISDDSWHNTKICREKINIIRKLNIVNVSSFDSYRVFPVGRAWDNRLFTEQKINCEELSNLTIIENGMICLCPFGYFPWKHFTKTTWKEAQDYVWRWRAEKIEEGMNCNLCMETDYAAKAQR